MLDVQDLCYSYACGGPSLRFPDLGAAQGSQVLLRGPSGSGKSTLLALLAGLLRGSCSVLRVGTADLARLGARHTDAWRGRELGFVPQRLHLSAGLSVVHNLELPYVAAGQPVEGARIAEVMQRLGLSGLGSRRPHELSVGQARRVALARAVLRRPRVLLVDEPTSNLDDAATCDVLALLSEAAAAEDATLVIATHDTRVETALPQALPWQLAAAEPQECHG
jgi:putative ABC transport system ATP-binding protein